jgi:hypothetical protein
MNVLSRPEGFDCIEKSMRGGLTVQSGQVEDLGLLSIFVQNSSTTNLLRKHFTLHFDLLRLTAVQ